MIISLNSLLVAELEFPKKEDGTQRKALGSDETFLRTVANNRSTRQINKYVKNLQLTVVNNAKRKGAVKINIYATNRNDFIAGKYYNNLVHTIDII